MHKDKAISVLSKFTKYYDKTKAKSEALGFCNKMINIERPKNYELQREDWIKIKEELLKL